jgi:hypothetical protein
MLGSGYDPGVNLGLGDTGQESGKIQHEFGGRVRNKSQVGINAFGFFFVYFDIDLLGMGGVFHFKTSLNCFEYPGFYQNPVTVSR